MGKAKRGRKVQSKVADPASINQETYVVKDASSDDTSSMNPPPVDEADEEKAESSMEEKIESEKEEERKESSDEDEEEEEGVVEEQEPEEVEEIENEDEEENEDDQEEVEVVVARAKVAPRKRQKENTSSEHKDESVKKGGSSPKQTKTRANLAKVLKAKGKDQKTKSVEKLGEKTKDPITTNRKKLLMLDMVLEGLSRLDERKGVTFPALKKYVMEDDSAEGKPWSKLRPQLRKALEVGLEENLILRPKGSENLNGLQGSFKINKKEYASRQTVSRKTSKATEDKISRISSQKTQRASKIPPRIEETKKTGSKKTVSKSRKPIYEVNSEDEFETKPKKVVGKLKPTKHRRSVSGDDVVMKKRAAGSKKTHSKSKSLDQLAPTSKKVKTRR